MMAKFGTYMVCLSRTQFLLQKTLGCKLCQKSASIYFNSVSKLLEFRYFSANHRILTQRNKNFAALNDAGTTETDGNVSEKCTRRLSIQEQFLLPVIEQGSPLTSSDWEDLKSKIFGYPGYINSFNFDAIAMGFCISAKQYNVGLSLIDHSCTLEQKGIIATLSRFLRLCYVCHSESVTKSVQATILTVYSKLKSLCPLMDGGTAENTIHGLALTDKWREGIELLSMVKLTCAPSTSTYSVLIKAAFDHDDIHTGWELMNEMVLIGRRPSPIAYYALLNYCAKCTERDVGQAMVEKLLSFFVVYDLRPTKYIAEELRLWFKKKNPDWKTSMTSLNNKFVCKSCKSNLQPISITKEEFGALRSNFIDKVVVGSNVFLKTTPQELEEFEKFLERSVPYDVVIDGLNVAYSAKSSKTSPHAAYLLQSAVKHFVDKSQKVLLFGRKHMQFWPKRPMNYIFNNAKTFLADNISQDDPFLLYATMYGGLGTCFVSRDLMRGHMYLLKEPALKAVFKRWQQQHQFITIYIAGEGDVELKPPLSFNPSVQRRCDGGWHIPYDEEYINQPPQTLEPPTQWLCVGPKPEGKRTFKTA